MTLNIGFIQVGICGLDCELSAVRHGVARIGREVHDDLLDLHRIRLNFPDVLSGREDELNVLANKPGQHFIYFANHPIQVQKLQRLHLLAAKGEQLPGEIRSPARCCHDFLNITAKRMFAAQRIQHQLGVRANDHQEIVEIVSHASSKPAYGVHFLCLLEL